MNEHSGERLRVLARARLRRALGELDYRRALVGAVQSGLSVSEIGAYMGIAPEALEGVLRRSGEVGEAPEGFSGVSPLEVCQRHAVGELDAEATVAQLSAWPYERGGSGPGDEQAPGAGRPRGQAWAQVGQAVEGDLISMEVYDRVRAAVIPRGEVQGRAPTEAPRDEAAACIAGVFDAEELAAQARRRYGLG